MIIKAIIISSFFILLECLALPLRCGDCTVHPPPPLAGDVQYVLHGTAALKSIPTQHRLVDSFALEHQLSRQPHRGWVVGDGDGCVIARSPLWAPPATLCASAAAAGR